MTLGGGGVFKCLLNSTPTEQHDADGPDFDSVLHKVLYCVILKQFHQHFNKKM